MWSHAVVVLSSSTAFNITETVSLVLCENATVNNHLIFFLILNVAVLSIFVILKISID